MPNGTTGNSTLDCGTGQLYDLDKDEVRGPVIMARRVHQFNAAGDA